MANYYDVTFHELSGKTVLKREIISDKQQMDVWQDACLSFDDKFLHLVINGDTHVLLNRQYIVRIDIQRVDSPVDKSMKQRDELMNVVNTLSNMGF